MRTLNTLPPPLFEEVLCALQVPRTAIPGVIAANGDRGRALVAWADSSIGCGIDRVQTVLQRVLTSHTRSALRNPKPLLHRAVLPAKQAVLAFMGLAGAVGLGIGLFVSRGPWPNPPANEPTELQALREDFGLSQAADALQAHRYAEARQALEGVLTQVLIGNGSTRGVEAAVWSLVADRPQSDMRYLQGRIHWQARDRGRRATGAPGAEAFSRGLARQALDYWQQTDAEALEGQIALGFAHYATGQIHPAIAHWERALTLYQAPSAAARSQPVSSQAANSEALILHAYAGLVMGRAQAAFLLNDPTQVDRQEETAAREMAIAQQYFQKLKMRDRKQQMAPANLQQITQSPATWHNWLWTEDLLAEWRNVYRRLEHP